jgi:hypothetical protein
LTSARSKADHPYHKGREGFCIYDIWQKENQFYRPAQRLTGTTIIEQQNNRNWRESLKREIAAPPGFNDRRRRET